MATGIVSVAARAAGITAVSTVLAVAAAVVYVGLAPGLPRAWRTQEAAIPLLTFVAGSDVLAARVGVRGLVLALWVVALLAWLAIGRRAAVQAAHTPEKARGVWLLGTVATQSLSVVGARLAAAYSAPALLAAAWAWWVLGLVLYVAVVGLMVRRGGIETSGDHWIVMGALAISGLAASSLVRAVAKLGWPGALADVARAGDWVLWVGAGAAALGLIAVELSERPRELDFDRWSTVFPLGMYSAATYALRSRTGSAWLGTVGAVTFWIALAAWATMALWQAGATRARPGSRRPRSRSRPA